MEGDKPISEHLWLRRMVGEWDYEGECDMGPNQPPMKSLGSESVRSLGGLWTIAEGTGRTPDGGEHYSVLTLGYDPRAKKFIGTFIASMMTHMWRYEGTLDESGKILTLDTEGPTFSGDGGMARYQDVVEIIDDDNRTLSSRILGADGKWTRFMTARYKRRNGAD